MSIQPLPDKVVAQIKSSTTITTLNAVVCGLLRNALDSGASKVTVSVDYVRGNCCVEDNGWGIPPAEFQPSGGLGKLHFTSKYPVREDVHGRYGTFLASLASLSLLSITSHHRQYHTHNSIQIHNSTVLARHIPSLPDQRLLSFPNGTRVAVQDLFGSMPVRVKQRSIDAERGIHARHWELLKRDIVALILAWDGRVSVSARELASRWIFSLHNNRAHNEESGLDLTARVLRILYQTQLSDDNNAEAWVPLKASSGRLSVAGAVSLHPIATKRIQFISIGIRPVSNEHGSNVLYEEINRIFSNSSYGAEEGIENLTSDGQERMAKDSPNRSGGFTMQELKGRKGVDRWPMFYIKLYIDECKSSTAFADVDALLDERYGNLAAIVDILKAVLYEFLRKYHFRPKRIRNTRDDIPRKSARPGSPKRSLSQKSGSRSTSATGTRKSELIGDLATTQLSIRCDRSSRLRPGSPFDFWSRIKSGSPHPTSGSKKINEPSTGHDRLAPNSSEVLGPGFHRRNSDSITPLFAPDGRLLRAPFATLDPTIRNIDHVHQSSSIENEPSGSNAIRWTNPATKETSMIDPTTGFVLRSPRFAKQEHEQANSNCHKRPQSHHTSAFNENQSVWLENLLSSWNNPIFKTTEPHIPSAFSEANSFGNKLQSFGCNTWLQGAPGAGPPIQGRVTKAALRGAEVVAQVDSKFIFAKVRVDSNAHEPVIQHPRASLLIIIDQHAADERCRVELLMKDYFEPTGKMDINDTSATRAVSMSETSIAYSELLERPLKFDISVRDAAQLEQMAQHFIHWGIHYHIITVPPTMDTSHRRVEVTRLPPSIAERCRLEPRLLIELLRKEMWKLDQHGNHITAMRSYSPQQGEATTPHWISRFHGCPEGILDMINSRACRSSIMFNDPLSQEECTKLLRRLADCAFPFQCAHGRPSMVPLVDLGSTMAYTSDEAKPAADSFGKAFRAWTAEERKKGQEE
ncbi:hypothetical protein F4678DRAFT_108908 [Xylaria arbuscula]|nr:hypothetical protein F4678DRAFT_108908 [Xylaria arbuscula]